MIKFYLISRDEKLVVINKRMPNNWIQQFYQKIRKWILIHTSPNVTYIEFHNSPPTSEKKKEVSLAEQEKQIQWIKDNVKFYPVSRTTVYHEGSANDILKACHKYKLNYQEAPRVFQTAVRWNISYLDMAEMMSNFDRAQTSS